MSNATGDTEQHDEVPEGTIASYSCFPPGEFAYVSAQINGPGEVRCSIERDGQVVASARSSGEFTIATCSD